MYTDLELLLLATAPVDLGQLAVRAEAEATEQARVAAVCAARLERLGAGHLRFGVRVPVN